MVFAEVLALELKGSLVVLPRLRIVAKFLIDGLERLPDGSLDERRASGCVVEPVSNPIEQRADFEVPVRLKA